MMAAVQLSGSSRVHPMHDDDGGGDPHKAGKAIAPWQPDFSRSPSGGKEGNGTSTTTMGKTNGQSEQESSNPPPGLIQRTLQQWSDNWEDFKVAHPVGSRTVEVSLLILQLGLYIYDIVSDILVVMELLGAGYILYGWLTAGFILSHYPLMGLLLLVFLRPMLMDGSDQQPQLDKQGTLKAAQTAAEAKAERSQMWALAVAYVAFMPLAVYMIPMVDLYMLVLPMVISRESQSWLIKVLNFFDSYEKMRFPLQCLLQSLPQVILQSYILIATQRGASGPDVSLTALAPSIAASVVNAVKSLVAIWLASKSSGVSLGMYLKSLLSLQGATDLHDTDARQLRKIVRTHQRKVAMRTHVLEQIQASSSVDSPLKDPGFPCMTLSCNDKDNDPLMSHLLGAQRREAMRMMGRRLLHDIAHLRLKDMLPAMVLAMVEAHEKEQAASGALQLEPGNEKMCCCIDISGLLVQPDADADWLATPGTGTKSRINPNPQLLHIIHSDTTSQQDEADDDDDEAGADARQLRHSVWELTLFVPLRLTELHLSNLCVDLSVVAQATSHELGQLVVDDCRLQLDAEQSVFDLLCSGVVDKVVLLTNDKDLAYRAGMAGRRLSTEQPSAAQLVLFGPDPPLDMTDEKEDGAKTGLHSISGGIKEVFTHGPSPINASVRAAVLACVSRVQRPVDVDLAGQNISYVDATALTLGLAHNTSVTSLDLSRNSLTQQDLKPLCDCLFAHHATRLRRIDLSDNPSITDSGADVLTAVLPFLPALEELRMERAQVTDVALSGLSAALVELHLLQRSCIQSVAISGNIDISAMSAHLLCSLCYLGHFGLGTETDGQFLRTCGAQLLAKDAWLGSVQQAVCNALDSNTSRIAMPSGGPTSNAGSGFAALTLLSCVVLHRQPQAPIQHLSLQGAHSIGDADSPIVARLVAGCPSLLSIDVSGTSISATGLYAISCFVGNANITGGRHQPACWGLSDAHSKWLKAQCGSCEVQDLFKLCNLDMQYKGIGIPSAKALAEALKSNTALQHLNLYSNSIGDLGAQALAEGLKSNTALQHLNLENNKFGDVGAQALAEALKINTTLQHLNLNNNSIGDFGAQALAEALKINTTLQHLNLCNNKFGDVGAQALAEALKSNTALQHLNLGHNSIGDVGAQALGEALKSNTALQHLNLSKTSIGGVGTQALAEALKSNAALQHLNLDRSSIGDVGAQALAEALKSNTALQHLNLDRSSIGAVGAQVLSEALTSNTALQHLNLDNNNVGDVGAQALAEVLKTNTALQHLNLNKTSIGAVGAQALAEALKSNTALQHLNLDKNSIGAVGAQALAEALKSNTTLQHLNLDENSIGAVGAQALAETLKANTALEHLNLYDNKIGAVGAQALAEALMTNTALQHLNLYKNKIGEAGAQALAEALKTNTALQHLRLDNNSIADVGAQALAEALKSNTALQHLRLYDNDIRDVGAQALAEALNSNTALQHLRLDDNKIGDVGAQALAEALKSNIALQQLYFTNNKIGAVGKQALAEAQNSSTTLQSLWF